MRRHRVVTLKEGPELALFAVPGILSRFALWLTEVLRDRIVEGNNSKKPRNLPLVVACLNEDLSRYVIVGVNSAVVRGGTRKKYVLLIY